MIAIVVVDNNWAIGRDNQLLAHLPTDLNRFKEITRESIVVMGRKTLESLPGGNPLPLRDNIVLTRDTDYKKKGVTVINNFTRALTHVRLQSLQHNQVVFIIGGSSIYKQFLPLCNKVYVTKIDHEFEGVDSFFPNLDEQEGWAIEKGKEIEENGFSYQYLTYTRR